MKFFNTIKTIGYNLELWQLKNLIIYGIFICLLVFNPYDYIDSWRMSKVLLLQIINIILLLTVIGFYLIEKELNLRKDIIIITTFFSINAILFLFNYGFTYEIIPYLVLLEFGVLISGLLDKFKTRNILLLLIVLCLIDSVSVYLQYLQIIPQNTFSVFKQSGFFDNPSHKSGLYVITMSFLFWEYNKKESKIFLFLLLLFSITVGIGGSRGAIFSILLMFTGIYIYTQKSRKILITFIVVISLLITAFLFLYSIRKNSFDNRLKIWSDSISQTIYNKPTQGFGAGSFEFNFNKNRAEKNQINDQNIELYEYIDHPHNEYVKIFFEYGLLGIFFFILILAFTIKYICNSKYKEYYLIVLFSLLFLSLVQFPFQILMNWMILILVFLMITKEKIKINTYWLGTLLIIFSVTVYASIINYTLRKEIADYVESDDEYHFNSSEFNLYFKNANLIEPNSFLTLLNMFQNEGMVYRVGLHLDQLKNRTSNPAYYKLLGRQATIANNLNQSIYLYEMAYKLSTVHLTPLYELSVSINKTDTPNKYIDNICLYNKIIENTYDRTGYISHYKLMLSMDSLPYECK